MELKVFQLLPSQILVLSVQDRVVVITGSGRGLGKAFAKRLLQDGAKVGREGAKCHICFFLLRLHIHIHFLRRRFYGIKNLFMFFFFSIVSLSAH